ncbi:hypothetical protein [Streptomyces sp. NRRL S-1813]|uniref:hypothetical protein n=1 Tax=Streptomyces sp. NRRL S-1813 TaxID=1463888 RepID=UPI0004C587DF|nr:hypothetical protein [Streptomyces sp. NRRL S-1813]
MITAQPARWHRPVVLIALMLAAFTFNTAENLPVGLLDLLVVSCWLRRGRWCSGRGVRCGCGAAWPAALQLVEWAWAPP